MCISPRSRNATFELDTREVLVARWETILLPHSCSITFERIATTPLMVLANFTPVFPPWFQELGRLIGFSSAVCLKETSRQRSVPREQRERLISFKIGVNPNNTLKKKNTIFRIKNYIYSLLLFQFNASKDLFRIYKFLNLIFFIFFITYISKIHNILIHHIFVTH